MEISHTIHLLGDILGKVIAEQESPEIFGIEEEIRSQAKARRMGDEHAAAQLQETISKLSPDQARAVAGAFAAYFDLVNLAEENYRTGLMRKRLAEIYPQPMNESIEDAVAQLKAQGVTHEEMKTLIENLSIELVLTAHPTEARRRTVLSKLQRINNLLIETTYGNLLPQERAKSMHALEVEISALWLTDRARTSKPAVTDEVRTGLYFVETSFWETLPRLYADLDQALAIHYPGLKANHNWLSLASWMGGDRDGNPFVTAEVTAETLRLHRGLAVEGHRRSIQEMARQLSISDRQVPPPPELETWLESRRPLPPHVAYIEQRYANEIYRLSLSLLASDLAEASQDDMTTRLLGSQLYQARIQRQALAGPLDEISKALPPIIANDELLTMRRQLDIFGLHAMRLDIREESTRYNAALGEVLRALNIAPDFQNAPASERLAILNKLLSGPLPTLARRPGITPATEETWSLFQLMARVKEVYGPELLGPVIISMTHSAADVLTVLALARWTGCDKGMHICPLVETVDDLRDAPDMLESLFTSPIYRPHLEANRFEQMVMIGYSDSNKDGGYLMANWSLYQTQENITAIADQHNVRLTIFHGRGGTIARGGGPANRAIRAQPAGSIRGRFRVTEQGEIIAARYANPNLAHRHLEQIAHAVLLASAPRQDEVPLLWRAALDGMSKAAHRFYRGLVYETPGFIDFWQWVTPIDEIRRLHIGSRPASRGAPSQVTGIRAIPWVFSWMQSRYNLPGWYGLGTGLAALKEPNLLREMYDSWPFFRTMLDNTEISLLRADMGIAKLYAELATDQTLGNTLFSRIIAEYERTRDLILSISRHTELLDHEPVTQNAVRLRNPYVDPLNYIQIETLRRLRSLPDPNSREAEPLHEVIFVTINGIAAGLRNTG